MSPAAVQRPNRASVSVSVTSASATAAIVDLEIYAPNGVRVGQRVFDAQSFSAGQRRTYRVNYDVPSNGQLGTYTVKVGIFSTGWGTLYSWNDRTTQFSVR